MSRRPSTKLVLVGALILALLLGGVVSYYASSSPDGLEHVAAEQGFDDTATEHDAADSPLADYGAEGVEDDRLSTAVAGVTGVVVVLLLAGGLTLLLRRRGDPESS